MRFQQVKEEVSGFAEAQTAIASQAETGISIRCKYCGWEDASTSIFTATGNSPQPQYRTQQNAKRQARRQRKLARTPGSGIQ